MVKGYLMDTNIISELRKGNRSNEGVQRWFTEVPEEQLFLSVLVVGEIGRGVELIRRRDPTSATRLQAWMEQIHDTYATRILPIDRKVAMIWGQLGLEQPLPPVDGLIAATALAHHLTLVTRNVTDVSRAGVAVLNPFEA